MAAAGAGKTDYAGGSTYYCCPTEILDDGVIKGAECAGREGQCQIRSGVSVSPGVSVSSGATIAPTIWSFPWWVWTLYITTFVTICRSAGF
jgi:hypothetical protein